MPATPSRPRSTLLCIALLWFAFYGSFTLFQPALLDDADSVHVEVAREMLLRHDYITLYANGIRYLEKAPLLYWAMAASMKLAMLVNISDPHKLAAAARFPLALSVLALALILEAFSRRLFQSTRAGLYSALITLSSFGIFLFTRITIPDAIVCLWITLALYCFYRTEEPGLTSSQIRLWCGGFAAACALNVLTKGLIGIIFPVAIVLIYLLLTSGVKRTFKRLRALHPLASTEAFLIIAAPWHILAGLANPTIGHPAPFRFINGHWLIPQPSFGNVRGWFWFYFMNEHILRYLNLRIPHDYDTVPLWLFWSLGFLWLLPFSAFLLKTIPWAIPINAEKWRSQFRRHDLPLKRRGVLLIAIWATVVLLFFSLSTRQEYYILPALPAIAVLIAGFLAFRAPADIGSPHLASEMLADDGAKRRIAAVILILGTLISAFLATLLIHAGHAQPNADLADLLSQHPGDYAMSLGHFMDLTGPSVALFRFPTALAAFTFFAFPLAAYILRKQSKPHAANLTLAAMAFSFLISVQLGLRVFAPVLTSAQLAKAIAPQLHSCDVLAIHGEYESASSLAFYLKRTDIHILDGHSSNLWYGSFFPDSPPWFETPESFASIWQGPRRVFLWQSLTDQTNPLPNLPGPVYILVKSGGKEIVSNQPNP